MSTQAKLGKGLTLSIGGTVIGEILECKPGKTTQAVEKVSSNTSNGLMPDYILGWQDVTPWEFKTVWSSGQSPALKAQMGSWLAVVIGGSVGTVSSFMGAITEIGDEIPIVGGWVTTSFKLAVNGNATS